MKKDEWLEPNKGLLQHNMYSVGNIYCHKSAVKHIATAEAQLHWWWLACQGRARVGQGRGS